MSARLYPKDLCKFINKFSYIPKKIKYRNELKQFAKYYCLEQNIGFKIEEVIEVSNQFYYQIKFLDNSKQAVIPYEEKFHYYELLVDKNEIVSLDSIVNSPIPYYGSEIKYWFYKHKINLDNSNYRHFKYLLMNSRRVISDR